MCHKDLVTLYFPDRTIIKSSTYLTEAEASLECNVIMCKHPVRPI